MLLEDRQYNVNIIVCKVCMSLKVILFVKRHLLTYKYSNLT